VVINGNRQHSFGSVLANYKIIQNILELCWPGQPPSLESFITVQLAFFGNNIFAQFDTLVADIYSRTCNQFFYFVLGFAAKRATQLTGLIVMLTHAMPSCLGN
jgi:hypothetical protein